MTRSNTAIINPELLLWARNSARMDIAYASKRLGVSVEKLLGWEEGSSQPTIKQLRNVAKVYKQNFAAFFLPDAPVVFVPPIKDYRRHHGAIDHEISPEIILDIKDSMNKRDIALELIDGLGEESATFNLECVIDEKPRDIGRRVRDYLEITFVEQKTLRDTRLAFNYFREKLEGVGILVFQSTKIDISEMRGYSIYNDYMPLIVVNRKDSYAARTFTLFHELTHLMLRNSGLCDLEPRLDISPHEQRLEVFCNSVAAETLVPDEVLLTYSDINTTAPEEWTNYLLSIISRDFGVSREVILRKLLDLGLTTQKYYEEMRKVYSEEAKRAKSKGGFVSPSVNSLSANGKQFVRLVMESLDSSVITPADASDYLGVRAKHFGSITGALRGK